MPKIKRKRIFSKAAGRKKPSRFSGNLIIFLLAFIVFVVLIVQLTLKPFGKFSLFGGAESGYWIKIHGSPEGNCNAFLLETNLPEGTWIYADWKYSKVDPPFVIEADHTIEEGQTSITNPMRLRDPRADCEGWIRFKEIEGFPYIVENTDGHWREMDINGAIWWKWWKAADLDYTEGPYFFRGGPLYLPGEDAWVTYAGFKLLSCSFIRNEGLQIELDDGRITYSDGPVWPGWWTGNERCHVTAYIPANVQRIKVLKTDVDGMLEVTSSSPDWEKEGEWLARTRPVVIPTGSPTPVERPTSAPTLTPTLTPRPTRPLKYPAEPTGRLPSPGIKY